MKDIFLNYFNNNKIIKNFINHNKSQFKDFKKISSSKILIEFNNFKATHIPLSYISNILAKKLNSEIYGFFNYSLIVSNFNNSIFNNIKWILSNFFSLNNFRIYRSFGVVNFLKPRKIFFYKKKSDDLFVKIYSKIRDKKDVINIKLGNITVGDLLYDTYLKFYKEPTLDIKTIKFQNFLKDFINLYFFWVDYFKKNKITAIIGVHTPYSYGLVLRIGIKKKIPTFVTSSRFIYKLSSKMPYMHGNFRDYTKIFKKFNKYQKIKAKKLAKEKLKLRFSGRSGAKVDLITTEISSFHKKKYPTLIQKNNKIKILIMPHDFFDAVHIWGKIFFSDFYEWLFFLGKMSNETKYDWYIKNRPDYSGKFKLYQSATTAVIKNFIGKYPRINLLPNYYSHKQIINEKINYVLTCYGSAGLEYAYHKIPVINASVNNPHVKYNFNYNPKNVFEYEYLIKNLNNLKNKKLNFSKDKILEYYFMRHMYVDKNWLIDDLEKMIDSVGGYDGQWSYSFYDYWLKNFTENKHNIVIHTIKNFLKSGESAINIRHSEKFKNLLS